MVAKIGSNELRAIVKVRARMRTDLLYLCKILNYDLVNEAVHGPMIRGLQQFHECQGKDTVTEKGYFWYEPAFSDPSQLSGPRRRLILDARGHYKTTINTIAHSIQWILNFPDVWILLVHASLPQAIEKFEEIRDKFRYEHALRYYFPEFCPQKRPDMWGTTEEFKTPCRRKVSGTPTMTCAGLEKAKQGSHYHVIKFCDIVGEENSGTVDQLKKTTKRFGLFRNLLVSPKHWLDVEGTRYDFCLIGDTLITMSDWSQKPIRDVQAGDVVVGWEQRAGGKRWLRRSRVTTVGRRLAPTTRYTLASGRALTCTSEHRFWRGKQWAKSAKNQEYSEIKLLRSIRRLLIPSEATQSLFGQLKTTKDPIVSREDAGEQEVFYFETETGNYIADGCCSKNSDVYGTIIDRAAEDAKKKLEAEKKNIPFHELPDNQRWQFYVRGCFQKDLGGKEPMYQPEELDAPDLLDEEKHEVPVFPAINSWDDLEAMRKDPTYGPSLFAAQMRNNPVDTGEDRPFPLNMIQFMPDRVIGAIPGHHEITVDTADTFGEGSNDSVITTAKVDLQQRRYIRDIRIGKFLPDEIVDHIFGAAIQYKAMVVKIEEYAFVRGLKPALDRKAAQLGYFLNILFIKRDTKTSKKDRILNTLQPWYKARMLRFSSSLPDWVQERIKQEFTRFPKYAKDDILDTIADLFQGVDYFGPVPGSRDTDLTEEQQEAKETTEHEKWRSKEQKDWLLGEGRWADEPRDFSDATGL